MQVPKHYLFFQASTSYMSINIFIYQNLASKVLRLPCVLQGPKVEEQFKAKEESSSEKESSGGAGKESKAVEGAAVVLQAIGETIVEIGKTTTELVAGHGESQTGDEQLQGIEKETIN